MTTEEPRVLQPDGDNSRSETRDDPQRVSRKATGIRFLLTILFVIALRVLGSWYS